MALRTDAPRLPLEASAEAIAVRGVVKSFEGAAVLKGVGLDVPAGTVVALLGPSGCGKTTLLRSIAGLERIDAGEISVGRRTLSGPKAFVAPEARRVGMVFQDWALFPHLTVGRNVAFGLPRRERNSRRIEEILRLVDLGGFGERMPSTLSGGQQQRVALARALANRPSVILLDEPFSNLDASLRNSIRLEVQRLLSDLGVTALFVTHQQEEAFVVGDRVAVMLDGEVVQQTTPAGLYEAPATRAVADFIGDANFLPGDACGEKAETLVGVVPLRDLMWGEVDVMVRPEKLVLQPGDDATVETIEFYGHDAVYLVRCNNGTMLRARVLAAPTFAPGNRVAVGYAGDGTVAYPRTP
ncbi:MAG TPA: ABC transporter ATP-binding protein [Actinomycetota bacterium]|nr:ABC transporter ATP-binding protein [Actinomycetota bacterium]